MSGVDFQQLVDQQYAPLYRFALSLAKSEADAADLTQQTFFLWASKGEQLRDSSKAKSWLFTTLYREFLNRHRHEARFPKVELRDAPEEAVSIVPNMDVFDGVSIMKTLGEVEEPFRAALTLFYLEQFSYQEIANVLGVPIGTVMSRLSRGKAQLRERLLSKKKFLGIKSLPSDQTEERNLMDNREAKFILNAYRPGGQDANDPRFAEALKQLRRDPILQHWFDESVGFDAAMTKRLATTPVPGDLRESILAGVKVARAPHWKNRWRKWAIAAAVVLSTTLGVLTWHNTRPAPVAGWQLQALDAILSSIARNESHFDLLSRNPADLVKWLRANDAPAGKKLPHHLDKLPGIGCKTFFWGGKPVSLICFTLPEGRAIHLVMTNVSTESDRAFKHKAKVIQQGHWATATWREGDMIYMLAFEGSRDELRSYLL